MPQQEIRFALVLYGGVSLAIYINGVVQELLRMVRATSGLRPHKAGTSEGIYRKLGSLLERGIVPPNDADPGPNDPIKTRFRIDIISGTSAGGLNGIYLAKALIGDKNIDGVQELWFSEGDISRLLNDSLSYGDIPIKPSHDAESLLNSRRMYYRLLKAFDEMDGNGRGPPRNDQTTSPLADEMDVFATTTDIEGVPVPIRLFDNIVYERRHRNDFHLRFIPEERNDFQADNNPFLAFAARCTSSFPFAFEPMRLCDIDEVLASDHVYAPDRPYCRSDSTRWQKFFTNYIQTDPDDVDAVDMRSTPFPRRSFGDGGYLNNAPFSYAVDALLARQPALPIDRKLLYVEPSPAHPEEAALRTDKPDAIENSLAALVTIPGYQTIRNDLFRMLERNHNAAKINKALNEVQAAIQLPERDPPGEPPEMPFLTDDCYRGCYQVRATDTTNQLALIAARALSVDEQSVLFTALRSLIRAWRDFRYRVASADPIGIRDFLERFDLSYRLRRLRFVLRKLDALHALPLQDQNHPAYLEALAVRAFVFGTDRQVPDRPVAAADLQDVWTVIAKQYTDLRQVARRLTEKPLPPDTTSPGDPQATASDDPVHLVRALLEPLQPVIRQLLSTIAGMPSSPAEQADAQYRLRTKPLDRSVHESRNAELACDARAATLLAEREALQQALAGLDQQLAAIFATRFAASHGAVAAVFSAPGDARDAALVAARYYRWFDRFDCVQFLMSFGTDIGEPDQVDIVRIAPEDASRLVPDVAARRRKLKGLVVAHFGAFLNHDWRVNDLLWGRLDAAERIITCLLPLSDNADLRYRLIDEAQNAILHEFQALGRLEDMATRQSLQPRPGAAITSEEAARVSVMIAAPPIPASAGSPPTPLEANQQFIETWQRVVPSEPDPRAMIETLARGTTITGRLFEYVALRQGLPGWGRYFVIGGRVLWGLVEISVPRKLPSLLARYWLSLLLLIAIVLIVAGLLAAPGMSAVGASLLILVLAIEIARLTLSRFLLGKKWLWVLILLLSGLVVIGIGYGEWRLYEWGRHNGQAEFAKIPRTP
jgi:predicted acylesterase/phospholipase RssA